MLAEQYITQVTEHTEHQEGGEKQRNGIFFIHSGVLFCHIRKPMIEFRIIVIFFSLWVTAEGTKSKSSYSSLRN
ncbi:MAG: hypothetical protein EXR90_07995 [Methyloglobulus sp.]|nr:hypothetical protein [Methyloglobulus sp.]